MRAVAWWAIASLAAIPAGAQEQVRQIDPDGYFDVAGGPLPLEIIVDLEDDASGEALAALSAELGLELRFNSAFSEAGEHLAVAAVASEGALQAALAGLRGHAGVEGAEPNAVYSASYLPDDPLYKHQWHLDMIHMSEAWQRSRGRQVVVAVIDTGVSAGNGDLKQVEDLKGTAFVAGYDFVNDRAAADDDHGHGTHVAGTIAQSTGNGVGVAGVAFEARIMPIKVLDRGGRGRASDVAEAIRWAADHGAQVINLSLGSPVPSKAIGEAVQHARAQGVVVVCAAGNSGQRGVSYPAAYPEAIAVAAVGPDQKRAFYSSFGPELDISAPGGDTRVDLNRDGVPDGVLQNTIVRGDPSLQGYFTYMGTSMASPHVAGVAALLIAEGVTDPDAVEELLEATALGIGEHDLTGAGLVDAEAALARAQLRGGWTRLGMAALTAVLVLLWARRRGGGALGRGGAGWLALGLIPAACGLFWLRGLEVGAPALAVLTRPIAEWPGAALGMRWHLNALAGSALLALAPAALLLGHRRLRPWCAGVAIGVAGYLLATALLGTVDVRWVPGHGALDRLWLLGNGLAAAVIGRYALPQR